MTKISPHGKDRRTRKDKDAAVSVWREKEVLGGRVVDAGVIILRTSGCSHFHKGGCSMCGYNFESVREVSPNDIARQFRGAMSGIGEVEMLKIYTSGSFLDPVEVAPDTAEAILRECRERSVRLLVESRAEYVNDENLNRVLAIHKDVEIAVGLESANDRVLKYSINKGSTVADYDTAVKLLRDNGTDLRSYVLVKPPFLTEAEAINDAVHTTKYASGYSKVVSINPVNVQKGTMVEKLWKGWSYRPPWLWSVVEVVKACSSPSARIVCDPVAGGLPRGAHNCGNCDASVISLLREYSMSQSVGGLDTLDCECVELWRTLLKIETVAIGGPCDLDRFFRRG